jgi:hypothetical protein
LFVEKKEERRTDNWRPMLYHLRDPDVAIFLEGQLKGCLAAREHVAMTLEIATPRKG